LSAILSFALITAYISILVSNFFGFSVVIINLFLFLIPAMVFVLNGQLNPQQALTFPNNPIKNWGLEIVNLKLAILVIFILFSVFYLLFSVFRVWSADTDYALGKQYNRAGEYEQAYDYLVNASQKRPGEPLFADELAINTTALALTAIQKNQSTAAANFANEAVRQSSYAIKTSPNNPTFWRSRIRVFTALAQMDEKYYEDALLAAQKSTELSPTDPEIFYNYALILTQLGQVDEAIAQMKKAHNLKPDYREPIYALGIIYHEVASDENAIAQMEYIIKNIASDDAQAAEKLLEWRGY
ncbi:tetratricopeptide repeat protein, partial [Candidatus Microgenomates bacterium]|nr:tetratricopeptide repeat protein [Candidatus Microgenomates bacterium]